MTQLLTIWSWHNGKRLILQREYEEVGKIREIPKDGNNNKLCNSSVPCRIKAVKLQASITIHALHSQFFVYKCYLARPLMRPWIMSDDGKAPGMELWQSCKPCKTSTGDITVTQLQTNTFFECIVNKFLGVNNFTGYVFKAYCLVCIIYLLYTVLQYIALELG